MTPEVPRILSSVASEPALLRWLHSHDPDRELDRDLLKSSIAFISDIPPQSVVQSAEKIMPPTASLVVPMYRRSHYVLGESYGKMSPNTMVINMLSAEGYCDPPDPICRRFVVDMSAPDSLQFIEYEWFSDAKISVSSHTINSDDCYQGETFLLGSQRGEGPSSKPLISKADLFTDGRPPFPLRVILKLRLTEISDCIICIANGSTKCVCPPTKSAHRKKRNQFVPPTNWEAWIHAFARSRRRLAEMKVVFSVVKPHGENDSSMSVSLQQTCKSGVDPASERGRTLLKMFMKAAGMIASHPQIDQPVAAPKEEPKPGKLENQLPEEGKNWTQIQAAKQLSPAKGNKVEAYGDSSSWVAPSGMSLMIAQKLEEIILSVHDEDQNSHSLIQSMDSAKSASEPRQIPENSQNSNQDLTHLTSKPGEIPRQYNEGDRKKAEREIKKGRRKGVQKSKVFECECGKVFRHRGHFNEHRMCVHERVRQHQCLLVDCESRFFKKSDRDRHMRSKHGDKVAQCTECGALLVKGAMFDAHIRHQHSSSCMDACD